MIWLCPAVNWLAENAPNKWLNAFQSHLCSQYVERTWIDRRHYLSKYLSDFQRAKIFEWKNRQNYRISMIILNGIAHLLVYKCTDRCKWSQITWNEKHIAVQCHVNDFLSCIFGTFFVTAGHINLCSASCQIDSRLFANASIATCNFITIMLLQADRVYERNCLCARAINGARFTCDDSNFTR